MINTVLTEINKALSNLEDTKAIREKRLGELRGKDRMVLCAGDQYLLYIRCAGWRIRQADISSEIGVDKKKMGNKFVVDQHICLDAN